MSVVTAALRELMALGVEGDALLAAVARIEQAALEERASSVQEAVAIASKRADDELADRKAKAAERTRKWREKNKPRDAGDETSVTVTSPDTQNITETPPTSPAAPRTCAQVVNPTSSLRSEGYPPVEPKGSTAPKGADRSRGTRLPDDWSPDEAGQRYAAEILGPDIDAARELDRFRDYWRAVPGAKGRKSDWPATWRNWCRTAADRIPKPRKAHERTHRFAQPTTRSDRRGVWAEVLAEERGEGPGFPAGTG